MNFSQRKIKILFITSLLDKMGGAEKNLCDVVLNLNKNEFQPFVLAFKGGCLTEALANKKIVVLVNNVKKLFSIHTLFKAFDLWRFIRDENIDVVVTYHHDADIFGSLVARFAGVRKVISSRRDMGYQLQKKHVWFYRLFGSLFSHFITVSDAVKFEILRRERIKNHKMTTIYNGLDIKQFRTCESERKKILQEEFNLSEDKITIGMVASFRPIKGQMYLVNAIESLAKWHDKIQIMIVGYNNTSYFREVEARIKELGLEKKFIITGARSDVSDLLRLFDLFVISSENEGFSNAIIEAMATGIPVIASNSGGNSEAIKNKASGLLFEPCDYKSLAASLTWAFCNESCMKRIGENGKKRVVEKFSLTQMIAANEAVYKK